MHGVQRPLSPYWIYRWEITMWLSSLHRITGLLLSVGAVALAVWLIALATGGEAFGTVSRVYGSGWFKPLLVGWTFCFFFHLANGVRHLTWDAGYGFDPKRIRASGWTVVVVTLVATAAFSYAAII
ncbi:MAG TPA: succinate dehydrogenase, cytochrome b556 subunit [Gammaproteobacteria bacterium]|nr:succinate dehydrogenase, cytochrome b556 subunit [Gammaproteobacteria bacterium]